MAIYHGYEPVIGLEVHAQLMTDSKIFCGCKNSYGEPPNSRTCPTCLGLPGALPVLNERAVDFAMRMILATGGRVASRSVFARKNYFYPDLPKGYQISQFDKPIGEGGAISYRLEDGTEQSCRLIRIHLEEDAGKSLHPEGGEAYTRVDLNRCSAPLIEIVSQPELHSPQEAYWYLTRLKQLLQYLEICTGDMEKGHLRCDANVSVRPEGTTKFGTRTEVKNMNTFKGVERAITYEINRQIQLLQSGGTVVQATMLWNEAKQSAEVMRSKEESHDYRYFPEPDLVNLVISPEWIEQTRARLPELPQARAERFVSRYALRLYDAEVLTDSRELADYYDAVMATCTDSILASNWVQSELLGALKNSSAGIADFHVRPSMLADLVNRIASAEISGKIAKTVFEEMVATGKEPAAIIQEKGLVQISDSSALQKIVEQVIADSPENVAKYKSGKSNLFAFFVGQVMKLTRGQANPAVVNDLLRKALDGE